MGEPWVSALGHLIALLVVGLLTNAERRNGAFHMFGDWENGNVPAVVIVQTETRSGHYDEGPPAMAFTTHCRFLRSCETSATRAEEALSANYFVIFEAQGNCH